MDHPAIWFLCLGSRRIAGEIKQHLLSQLQIRQVHLNWTLALGDSIISPCQGPLIVSSRMHTSYWRSQPLQSSYSTLSSSFFFFKVYQDSPTCVLLFSVLNEVFPGLCSLIYGFCLQHLLLLSLFYIHLFCLQSLPMSWGKNFTCCHC